MVVNSVEIIDDHLNLRDHLPIVCSLGYIADQAPVQLVSDNFYYVYVWTDATKQQFYYSTGTSLQYLMNDIYDNESNISADEYVNVLHNDIVNVLNDCSIINYTKFVKTVNNYLQWSHALEQLKTASKNVLNDWRVTGCPVNDYLKEKLVKVRREYKKSY